MCRHRRTRTLIALVLITSLLFSYTSTLAAAEATLSEFIVTNTRDHLLIYFRINGCFTPEMDEAILNGIPTTFTILIRLYRTRSFWFDETITSLGIEHTIKYDALRNEFRVTRSEANDGDTVFKNFAAAKKAMAEIKNIPVASLSSLRKHMKYQLRVKAELEKVRLPLFLHYVFFFVSLWNFETDWYTIDFTY
ncbi:MAG: DUF4390 domain-containing protein [Deltaproteobacteria bacterium]|nr:DUF4390 domain-containing protein [Deltaproteobacteria bacterium]MBW2071228.1 DUF4390 domain-containing protein [Deltaproteobacteria bacterium]